MSNARPLVIYPDLRLQLICRGVAEFDAALAELAQDMLATMYQAQGRGLAAPQVGSDARLFVMDATWKEGVPAPEIMVNPVILRESVERVAFTEGCLSIPDQPRRILRPARIRLGWQDLDGRPHEAELDGIRAVIAQHERDHLDGVLILDHPETPEAP